VQEPVVGSLGDVVGTRDGQQSADETSASARNSWPTHRMRTGVDGLDAVRRGEDGGHLLDQAGSTASISRR